jgi:hypothetical protein
LDGNDNVWRVGEGLCLERKKSGTAETAAGNSNGAEKYLSDEVHLRKSVLEHFGSG